MTLERQLSEVLSEFARTLGTDFPIQAILDHLVVRIAEVLPVTSAGVTLISSGSDPQYVAASDDAALRYEKLQTGLGEGPCTAAFATGEAVHIADLRDDDRFPRFAERALAEGLVAVFTFPLRHGDGQLGALDLYRQSAGALSADTTSAAETLADVATAYLLNAQAREDLHESAERARQISMHDGLTGLPNRSLLVQRLDHAIARCRRSKKLVAILFADLDGFKSINDNYGHHIGDELLIAVAKRLTGMLRPGDTLARLAGDEFVILCEDLDNQSQVQPIASRISSGLVETFVLSDAEVRVSASVGIAFAGRGDQVPEEVLNDADTAMYQAKRRGGANHGVMDLREKRSADHRANLKRDLSFALERGELRTEYQPIVATADGRITGAEALLRWRHPTRGMIGPSFTVPLAEHSGLITEIGSWVLRRACLDRQSWQHRPTAIPLEISVNVSVYQLMAPNFPETVAAVLAETDTDPSLLTLEVTENVFIQDTQRALVVLHDLKTLGVRLALDDFGTGYASLSYLKQFPVDVVKIDRTFISGIDRDLTNRLIASAIIGLAHGLDITVVAEGVETVAQYEQVVALGCDAFQGFYFARPASTDDLDTFMAGGQRSAVR